MTQNQLKYWELRWRQWYEYQLLHQQERQLEETKRSNRAKERIEYEKITISREDMERKWAELDEKKRAAMVGEAINKYKADIEFADAKSRIDKRLSEIQIAEADLAIAFTKARNEDERQYIKLYADVADKGWDGVAGAALGTLYANNKSQDWDKVARQAGITMQLPTVGIQTGPGVTNTDDSNTWSTYVESKKSKVIDTTGKNLNNTGYMDDSIHSYTAMLAKQKAQSNVGTNYGNYKPVDRDSYKSSPQTNVTSNNSGAIASTSMGNAGPSNYSGPKSSGKSGVIVTTNINKGPGY